MNCDQSEMWMTDAVDDTLAGAERRKFMAHLEGCTHCRSEWQALTALERVLANPPRSFPAPGFVYRVETRLDHYEAQRRTLVGGLILLGAAAALSLVALLLLLNGRNPIAAYGAFLRETYHLLLHGLTLGYQLVSTGWLVLNALAGSVNVPLANMLFYGAALALLAITWRRVLVSPRVHTQRTRNGH